MKKKLIFHTIGVLFTILMASCSEDTLDEERFGTLTGRAIIGDENTPIENVKITTNPVSNTVFTDVDGYFIMEDILEGDYSVQAEIKDFQTAFNAAKILEGKTSDIVFELESTEKNNLAPNAPVLLSPMDKAIEAGTEIEFIWSSSIADSDTDEILYELHLRNGSTNETSIFEKLVDTTYSVDNLLIGTNYSWQVVVTDGVNEPVQSAVNGFTTQATGSNRFHYVRNIEGNYVIFSNDEPSENSDVSADTTAIRLTALDKSSFRPIKNTIVDKLAFLRFVGAETHLFVMNTDGTAIEQVTNMIPLAAFEQEELEFSWYGNGSAFLYPNFNRLYSINVDGSGNNLEYVLPPDLFITEIAVNPTTSLVALKMNDADGYNARIALVNLALDTEEVVVIENVPGALGGLDFSIDGSKILYTRDVSGVENPEYRQLDARIFEYDLILDETREIGTGKLPGTNDLDPKYAPDDGSIIYMNTSNDGLSEKSVYRILTDTIGVRELLFSGASMPNWE